MQYLHKYENGVLVIEIDDDRQHLPDIEFDGFVDEILLLNNNAESTVLLDLIKKKHFNSSDLGVLIKVKDRLFDNGIELCIMNPSDNVLELLKIVGLKDFFRICDE